VHVLAGHPRSHELEADLYWAARAPRHPASVLTESETFAGKDAIHLVDNISALYCAFEDYSKSPDSARIVHCIHSVLRASDTTVWFEYVPSKENTSDGPLAR
jgi:hypothetical protein